MKQIEEQRMAAANVAHSKGLRCPECRKPLPLISHCEGCAVAGTYLCNGCNTIIAVCDPVPDDLAGGMPNGPHDPDMPRAVPLSPPDKAALYADAANEAAKDAAAAVAHASEMAAAALVAANEAAARAASASSPA